MDMEMDPEIVAGDRDELLEGLLDIPSIPLTAPLDDWFGSDGVYIKTT